MREPKICRVLVGAPGSGKTTYRKMLLKSEPGKWVCVSRDDLRENLYENLDPGFEAENHISQIQSSMIIQSLKAGYNVVVDACHTKQKYRNMIYKLCQTVGNVKYEEHVFYVPLDICLERNAQREKKVPENVVRKFHNSLQDYWNGKLKPRSELISSIQNEASLLHQDQNLPKACIFDLDGTTCLLNGRDPYDASTCDKDLPNHSVLECAKAMNDSGYKILFVSGRMDKYREPTLKFLNRWFTKTELSAWENYPLEVPRQFELLMRKTDDERPDTVIKEEIWNEYIKDKYNILFVVDDRPRVSRMFRYQIGLPVFQVNDVEF